MTEFYTALIIDDEQPARNIIAAYLKKWEQIKVVGQCSNGFEALKAIRDHQPQLLFLDVQMPKITGLELLEVLDTPVHVIFTTAYDQYALKAFELNAVDYLLKPFTEKRFGEAINKVIQKIKSGDSGNNQLAESVQAALEETLPRIVVKKGTKLEVIGLEAILYLEAQEDYVMIHTETGHFLKSKTMKYFEDHLPNQFIRIHRSYILNVEKIQRLEPYDKDTYLAVLNTGQKIKVSRTGYKKLRQKMEF